MPRLKDQQGFTLIEVMVAVVIFAIGLAGIAAMLLGGISGTNTANLRSIATVHAQSAADMMRANLDAYEDGYFTTRTTASTVTCSGTCSSAQMAANDFAAWQAEIAATLPRGVGIICTDSTIALTEAAQPANPMCDGSGNNVVKIFWVDEKDTSKPEAETFHRFVTMVYP